MQISSFSVLKQIFPAANHRSGLSCPVNYGMAKVPCDIKAKFLLTCKATTARLPPCCPVFQPETEHCVKSLQTICLPCAYVGQHCDSPRLGGPRTGHSGEWMICQGKWSFSNVSSDREHSKLRPGKLWIVLLIRKPNI